MPHWWLERVLPSLRSKQEEKEPPMLNRVFPMLTGWGFIRISTGCGWKELSDICLAMSSCQDHSAFQFSCCFTLKTLLQGRCWPAVFISFPVAVKKKKKKKKNLWRKSNFREKGFILQFKRQSAKSGKWKPEESVTLHWKQKVDAFCCSIPFLCLVQDPSQEMASPTVGGSFCFSSGVKTTFHSQSLQVILESL